MGCACLGSPRARNAGLEQRGLWTPRLTPAMFRLPLEVPSGSSLCPCRATSIQLYINQCRGLDCPVCSPGILAHQHVSKSETVPVTSASSSSLDPTRVQRSICGLAPNTWGDSGECHMFDRVRWQHQTRTHGSHTMVFHWNCGQASPGKRSKWLCCARPCCLGMLAAALRIGALPIRPHRQAHGDRGVEGHNSLVVSKDTIPSLAR